jgi:hypothetical protein
MKLELEGLLKEAFGVDQAKASDLSNPNTPYTFANTLEWAVGVQPKKEPSQVSQGTPMAKQFPQEAITEPGLVEPVLSPLDIVGTGIPTKVGKTALEAGMKQIETGTGFLGKLIPDPRQYLIKTADNPTWNKEAAAGFLKHENKMTTEELWKKYGTYRGFDGTIRQYDYDGQNIFNGLIMDDITKGFSEVTSMENRKASEEFLGKKGSIQIKTGKLGDILNSPNLYNSYPDFRNIKVEFNVVPGTNGDHRGLEGSIRVANANKPKAKEFTIKLDIPTDYLDHFDQNTLQTELLSTLHHELTHGAQFVNKLPLGSSTSQEFLTKADIDTLKIMIQRGGISESSLKQQMNEMLYKNYLLSHGETEARAAEGSFKLGQGDFVNTPPTKVQAMDLKKKAEMFGDYSLRSSNLKQWAPEVRLFAEWGSATRYREALKELEQLAKSYGQVLNVTKDYKTGGVIKSSDANKTAKAIGGGALVGDQVLNEGEPNQPPTARPKATTRSAP